MIIPGIAIGPVVDVIDSTTKSGKAIRTIVLKDNDKPVAFETWKPDEHNAQKGQTVVIKYVVRSSAWNGKFFTTANILDMQVLGGSAPAKATRHDDDYPDRELPF